MGIWLNTIGMPYPPDDCYDCSDDCHDCNDCGDCEIDPFNPINLFDSALYIKNHIFCQIPHLYVQSCAEGKWLICNPTELGQIVVLDRQALGLLEQFRSPVALSELTQDMFYLSPASAERTVGLFYNLGFLQSINHPLSLCKNKQIETLSAWLHVTNACNLRCHYCYLSKSSEYMANDVAFRAIDSIFRSALHHDYQRVQLKYAGGEASLQLNNVLAIHDYAVRQSQQHAMEPRAYILSNGVALTQRMIDQFKERKIGIAISLDGIGASHDIQRPFINGLGSFKYVDRTITRLLTSELVPFINVTVSQRNLSGLTNLVEYLLDRNLRFTFSYYRDNDCSAGLKDLQYTEDYIIGKMLEVFNVIEQRLPKQRLIDLLLDKASLSAPHQHTCGVGRNYLVIDQHGGVAKCQSDINHTVTTIDAEDPLQAIRDDRDGVQGISVEKKEGCRDCQWRYWCTGGCPLLTHRLTGRYDIKSPNCNIYKALFPEILRLEALRLLKYTSPITF